jgi:sterol 24-C-methyltransferase
MSVVVSKDFVESTKFHGSVNANTDDFVRKIASKSREKQQSAVEDYLQKFEEDTETGVEARRTSYTTLVNNFYDLGKRNTHQTHCLKFVELTPLCIVTDFYEYGWGQSFHFCRFFKGEAFHQAIARHEHYIALKLNLRPGMQVVDVGCGVGKLSAFISSTKCII